VTVVVAAASIFIVVCGKLSLGRSFGLAPANRGVVSTTYRFARHPIYLGYLITHLGFLVANPTGWNFAVLRRISRSCSAPYAKSRRSSSTP
jgi:protein-S-isoprenylcysteine O-methyltransferase Ste14